MTTAAAPPARSSARPPQVSSPELAWAEAEAALLALSQQVEANVRTEYDVWLAAVREELLVPLEEALRAASRAHRPLADGLAEASADGHDLWRRRLAYRRAVHEEVLAPLRRDLSIHLFGDALGTRLIDLLQELAARADALPAEAVLPDPLALYAPEAQDGFLLRRRKAAVRTRRRLRRARIRGGNLLRRLARRPPRPFPSHSRTVPARHLFAYHLLMRLPEAVAPAHEVLQQHVARRLAPVVHALTNWTEEVLSLEQKQDRAAYHRPQDLEWPQRRGTGPSEGEAAAGDDATVRSALVAQAAQLQNALEAAAAAEIVLPPLDEDRLASATRALEDDLAKGGTFFLKVQERPLPPSERQVATTLAARHQAWAVWHGRLLNRLDLCERLLTVRAEMLRVEQALLDRVAARMLQPMFDTFAALRDTFAAMEAQTRRAFDAAAASGATAGLLDVLRTLQEQAAQQFQEALSELPGLVISEQVLMRPAAAEEEELAALVQTLPESLSVHRAPAEEAEKEAAIDPEAPARSVPLRALAEDALAPPLSERLARPADVLRKQLLHTWAEAEDLQNIIHYNLDAAADELETARPEDEPWKASADTLSGARELATDGFSRTADRLLELAHTLRVPWEAFLQATFEAFEDDWSDLHRSAESDAPMERQWYGLQMRLRRGAEQFGRRSWAEWQALSTRTARLFRSGRSGAQQLIQRGRTAVGGVEVGEEEQLRTIDALLAARALPSRLPLIYRRLFSFEPLTEVALLDGRAADLEHVRLHYERWRATGTAGALVLSLPLGSGRTSLLNVLHAALSQEADVRRLPLQRRIPDEADFAARAAEALGLPSPAAASLDALEQHLSASPPAERPVVCLLDNLEHLLLRIPGGTGLAERVLLFFARTGEQVYWVATTGDRTWRFIETTAGASTGLVTALRLDPLDRAALEHLILNRHRRSGMPLRFVEPQHPSPLLRQRLRRAKTPEARQEALRSDYFDRLHRLSGQNILLALLYWLRSADFAAEEDVLTVQPLLPLSFGFLGRLDLAQAFTLKAFIQHHTLTLDEHARIFRLPETESTFVLEALLHLHLIEPVPAASEQAAGTTRNLSPHLRYRLNPFTLHPVTEYLVGRHILY